MPGPDAVPNTLTLNQIQVVGKTANALEYGYPTLGVELGEYRVRQLELDLWSDEKGGLYARPLIRTLTLGGKTDPLLRRPGIKVLHIQDVDYCIN